MSTAVGAYSLPTASADPLDHAFAQSRARRCTPSIRGSSELPSRHASSDIAKVWEASPCPSNSSMATRRLASTDGSLIGAASTAPVPDT